MEFKSENLRLGEVLTIPIDFVVTKLSKAGHFVNIELTNDDLDLNLYLFSEDLEEIMRNRREN